MRAALIDETGLVVNVILLEPGVSVALPQGSRAVAAPDRVGPGWRLEGEDFVPPVDAAGGEEC